MTTRRPRILIITKGDIFRLVKIVKLAKTFTQAGYEVVRLGFKLSPEDAEETSDEYGAVIRVDDPSVTGTPGGSRAKSDHISRTLGPRDALKRILFSFEFGRKLRARVLSRRMKNVSAARVQKVSRWNAALAERGIEVQPDLVISSQLPVLEAGHSISRACDIPLVYDVRDLFTVAGYGSWSDPQFIDYEQQLIRDASLVMTVTPSMADFLEEQYGIGRPLVLYNCGTTRAAEALRPKRPVRVLFQGYFSPLLHLPEVVRGIALLEGSATLTLQGEGAAEEELRSLVEDLSLEDVVRFEPFVPPLEAALAANAHDIGISHRRAENENLRRTLPNKLFDYLGGGLAVLSSDVPSMRDVIERYECGALFEPSGPESIAEALDAMSTDLDELWRMKRNALEAWSDFAWDTQEAALLEEIERIIGVAGSRQQASQGRDLLTAASSE